METTQNKIVSTTADAVMHFSAFTITGESDRKQFANPVVVNYALSYLLRFIKQNPDDQEIYNHYKDVFWYIAANYKKY